MSNNAFQNLHINWKLLLRGLLAVAVVTMVIHFLIYLAFGISLIPFPFDYDQAEGFELNNAILLSQGRCPYCDNDVFPFYASGYAPFFHMVMVPFVWIFGPNFWYGRLIIFVATLITAWGIAYAVRRDTKSVWIPLVAGLSFLASNYIYHIGPLLRQHLLMVMLETLAVIVVANAFDQPDKQRRNLLLIGFTLLLLAGYTKQLAYSTVIAVFLWMFLRNPRTALFYGIGLAVMAALIFGAWMLITEGQWWVNIISSNQNPYITEQFTGLIKQFIRLHYPLLILAGLMVIYELYFTRLSVYSIWFVVSFASTVGAGKWGAGDSYFATTLASACILAGVFVARTWHSNWCFPEKNYIVQFTKNALICNIFSRKLAYPLVTATALLAFVVYGFTVIKFPTSGAIFTTLAETLNIEPAPAHRYPLYDSAGWTVGYAVTGHFPSQDDYTNGWKIAQRVDEADGFVMSEDAGFSIQMGREVITNAVQLNNLYENDLYDPTELLSMIENHEFGLVITRARFFPDVVMVAIETYYRIDEKIPMNGFEYELWVPKMDNPES